MHLTPEERELGQENYYSALSVSRRDFLTGAIAAGAVSGAGLGAMYFGYDKIPDPVRVAVIGTGDDGQVLIVAHNPEYVQIVAICVAYVGWQGIQAFLGGHGACGVRHWSRAL